MVIRRLVATGSLVLLTAAAGRAHSHPHPPQSWRESGWKDFRYKELGLFVEGSAGPIGSVDLGNGQVSAGYGARIGVREPGPPDNAPFLSAAILDACLGESWSLEATFRAFGGDAGRSRFFVGLSLTSLDFIGIYPTESRLRGPTVLGIAIPEVGFWFPAGGFAAPYLSYSAPFSYLVSEHVAVELRPSLTITFHHDSTPNDLHGWLSAAVLWR